MDDDRGSVANRSYFETISRSNAVHGRFSCSARYVDQAGFLIAVMPLDGNHFVFARVYGPS